MIKKYLLLDPRFIAYRPAMELPAVTELRAGVFERAGYIFESVVKRVRDSFARRASIKALSALDDRLLRDIGIDRYTLESTVDAMLKGDAPVAVRPLATVHRFIAPEVVGYEETLRPAA